jgi:hypothetical protein
MRIEFQQLPLLNHSNSFKSLSSASEKHEILKVAMFTGNLGRTYFPHPEKVSMADLLAEELKKVTNHDGQLDKLSRQMGQPVGDKQ